MNIEIVSRVTLQHVDDDIATLMGVCGMDKATWEPGTVSVPIISFIDFSIYLSSSVTQKNIFLLIGLSPALTVFATHGVRRVSDLGDGSHATIPVRQCMHIVPRVTPGRRS